MTTPRRRHQAMAALADYGMTAPTSFIALSVSDSGTLELQLLLNHA